MSAKASLMIVLALLAGAAGCGGASAREPGPPTRTPARWGGGGETLPGRSRPLLAHDWPHPRDLRFAANGFVPPDAQSALVTTPAGLRAYVIHAGDDRVVQIVAAVPLGRMFEPANEAGAAELLSRLLSQQVDERLGRGFTGRLQVEQDVDLTRLSLQMLADDWRIGLSALVAALRQPRFDPAAIDAYRTGPGYVRQTRGLGGARFRPAIELALLLGDYPLTPPKPGLTVRREAVRSIASRSLRPDAVVLGIGGDVSRADAQRELESLTAGWQAGATTTEPASGGALKTTTDRVRAIDEPGFTTWVAVGHPMPPIAPRDEAAVAVMTEILNIRLNIAAREIRGLANQVVLQVPATTRHAGLLHVRTGARPESIAPLLHYSRQELRRIREEGGSPTTEELEQVKGGLVLGKWQASLDGARTASATYATETVRYGSLDRLARWPVAVRAVTARDVRAAAVTYVYPDKMGTVIIGPIDAIRRSRHPRWPVTLDEVLPVPHPRSNP